MKSAAETIWLAALSGVLHRELDFLQCLFYRLTFNLVQPPLAEPHTIIGAHQLVWQRCERRFTRNRSQPAARRDRHFSRRLGRFPHDEQPRHEALQTAIKFWRGAGD